MIFVAGKQIYAPFSRSIVLAPLILVLFIGCKSASLVENCSLKSIKLYHLSFSIVKEARCSFSGLRVEVLKLQSYIQDKLRSPSYYIVITTET